MKIIVGSKNPIKVNAVRSLINKYSFLNNATVDGVNANSNVSNQPKSLTEIIEGARNRAKAAFQNCDLTIGLESGIFPVPYTKSGYMDTTACAIYDGEKFHLGLSSCFEYPQKIITPVLSGDLEIHKVAHDLGMTEQTAINQAEGMIGYLTKNRITREHYTKNAIQMALIHLENKDLY